MSATKSGDLRETAHQASRYLIVIRAFIALAVDATITSVAVKLGVPVLVARVLALLTGGTVAYAFYRRYTFSPATSASFLDWRRYVAGQALGAALNFTISGALLYYSDRHIWQIWGAVLAGAGVGFCINFFRRADNSTADIAPSLPPSLRVRRYRGGCGRELRMSTAVFGSRLAGLIGGTCAAVRAILRM